MRILWQDASAEVAHKYVQQARQAMEQAGVPALNAKVINEEFDRMVSAQTEEERRQFYLLRVVASVATKDDVKVGTGSATAPTASQVPSMDSRK